MYYFYILKSDMDDGYYYGSTKNIKNRVNEHLLGKVASTKYRRPFQLMYYEAYQSIDAARKREKQVKKSSSIRMALHKRINL